MQHLGVVIPTYNAAQYWPSLQKTLDEQGISPQQILIIDSSSTDATVILAEKAGYQIVVIPQSEFNHGRTRQIGCEHFNDSDVLIYLTQDALPADEIAFQTLYNSFADSTVGAAFGRQLPRAEADAIEQHARLYNYPALSHTRTYEDRKKLGIKTAFLSNSFAGYRRSALLDVGGFPANVIMAEDSVVAARMLLKGWRVAYVADARVVHSHPFTLSQEFRRYFDTGVHHSREAWLRQDFGEAAGEGKRFVVSEIKYLLKVSIGLIPIAIIRTLVKLVAYKMGLLERYLPPALAKSISLQPLFWQKSWRQ